MRFARYNSALMVFHLCRLGMLDVQSVVNLVFLLCTRVSIMPLIRPICVFRDLNGLVSIISFTLGLYDGSSLTHQIIYQQNFPGGNYICIH